MKYEEEKIYYIQWLNLGNEKVLNDLSFDLSGFQVENRRWDHSANYYNEAKDTVYVVFTAFPLWDHDETLSMSGSHRILMLVEFKTNTPKQYSVTVFQTDEHGGAEWFFQTNRINNTLYQMSDMDTPTLLNIYVAYRGEEFLGYMVIDEETKEVLETGF